MTLLERNDKMSSSEASGQISWAVLLTTDASAARGPFALGWQNHPSSARFPKTPEHKCDEGQQHHPSIQEICRQFYPLYQNDAEAFAMQFWL
jgi:hypothetical protein